MARRRKNPDTVSLLIYAGLAGMAYLIYKGLKKPQAASLIQLTGPPPGFNPDISAERAIRPPGYIAPLPLKLERKVRVRIDPRHRAQVRKIAQIAAKSEENTLTEIPDLFGKTPEQVVSMFGTNP